MWHKIVWNHMQQQFYQLTKLWNVCTFVKMNNSKFRRENPFWFKIEKFWDLEFILIWNKIFILRRSETVSRECYPSMTYTRQPWFWNSILMIYFWYWLMVILLTRVIKCLYNKICLGIVQQLGQNKPAEKLLALAIKSIAIRPLGGLQKSVDSFILNRTYWTDGPSEHGCFVRGGGQNCSLGCRAPRILDLILQWNLHPQILSNTVVFLSKKSCWWFPDARLSLRIIVLDRVVFRCYSQLFPFFEENVTKQSAHFHITIELFSDWSDYYL